MRVALAVAVAMGLASIAAADPALAAVKKQTNIPAQELGAALQALAKDRNLQLVYATQDIDSHRTGGAVGELSATEALTKLLNGTGLTYTFLDDTTITVAPVIPANSSAKREPMGGAPSEGKEAQRDAEKSDQSFWGQFRLAQVDQGSTATDTSEKETVEEYEPTAGRALPEVLVSGTKSLNADIERSRDDIQPYIVIGREVIERSGASDIAELLRNSLSANSSYINTSASGAIQGNTTLIGLRGLSPTQTLILVDGRRAGAYSLGGDTAQPDLNSIPLSAIERIDVLPISASGIYGGSATGGVVNVVLRRDYTGIETTVTHDDTFNSNSARNRVDLNSGFSVNGGRTSILLSGSYSDANPLLVRDRSLSEEGRQTILQNNPSGILGSSTPPLGRTTNVSSMGQFVVVPVGTTGATCFGTFCFMQQRPDLTLKSGASLGSPIAYVPPNYSGIGSDGGAVFLSTAGAYNLDLASSAQPTGGGKALLGSSLVKSIRATVRHEFSKSVTGFLELSGSSNASTYAINLLQQTFTIPSASPNNPFNQDISVTTPMLGGDSELHSKLDDRKGVAGVIIRLPWGNWQANVDYTKERTEISYAAPTFGISPDGSVAVQTGAADVLRDTNRYPIDFGQYRLGDTTIAPVKTTLDDLALRVGGSIASMKAGSVDLTVNLERSKQKLGEYVNSLPAFDLETIAPARQQIVNSMYAELRVPLVSDANRIQGIRLLELQVAGRFDDYKADSTNNIFIVGGVPDSSVDRKTNRFNSFVPTFGVRLSPISDLMFRASYAEGFLPPSLTQLVPGADTVFPGGFPDLLDPRRGNAPIATPVTLLTGGNPDLDPETSESRSLGVVLTPRFVPGLRLSIDWTKINKKNNIDVLGATQLALDNELLIPGLITRGPTQNDGFNVGPVTVINGRALNFARASVVAYDWALDYTVNTEQFGTFIFGSGATQQIHNQTQTTPLSDILEMAEQYSTPRWLANATLTWKLRGTTLGWTTRYLGSYFYLPDHSLEPNEARAEAPSAVYHDFFASYQFKSLEQASMHSVLDEAIVSFGIKDIFNTAPRVDVTRGVYTFDMRADPRQRSYYLSFRKPF